MFMSKKVEISLESWLELDRSNTDYCIFCFFFRQVIIFQSMNSIRRLLVRTDVRIGWWNNDFIYESWNWDVKWHNRILKSTLSGVSTFLSTFNCFLLLTSPHLYDLEIPLYSILFLSPFIVCSVRIVWKTMLFRVYSEAGIFCLLLKRWKGLDREDDIGGIIWWIVMREFCCVSCYFPKISKKTWTFGRRGVWDQLDSIGRYLVENESSFFFLSKNAEKLKFYEEVFLKKNYKN